MKFLKSLIIVMLMVYFAGGTVAQTYTFNEEHPRLFLTEERIERIRTQHVANNTYEWTQTQKCANRSDIDGAVAKSLVYRVTGNTDAALEAVNILANYVSQGNPSVNFNNAGPFFNKWALCYDWLHGFTEFELIKNDIIQWVSTIDQDDWDYYLNNPYMNGHQKAIWGAPLWGMATSGDNPDANTYIDSGEERWKRTRYLLGYGPDALATWKDGIMPSGHDYGSGTLRNTLIYMIAAEDSYGKNTFEEAPYVKNIMKGFLHQFYYDTDYFHRTEHGNNAQKGNGYFANDALLCMMLQEKFPDCDESKMIQRWFAEAPGAWRYPARDDRFFSYWGLIFKDYSIEEMDIELPKGYLAEWPGIYIHRSDYNTQAPPSLYWTFRSGNQIYFNQNHFDNGNIFVAWKGDNLIIDAGLYEGTGGINTINYHLATIAHNVPLIKDPLEIYGWKQTEMAMSNFENSGGQRLGSRYTRVDAPIDGWIPEGIENTFPQHLHDAADIIELVETDSLVYILSNNTNSYMNTGWEDAYHANDLNGYGAFYRPKVDNVEREVVNVGNSLVLFDRVIITDPTYDTYITYHSIWEPVEIGGNYLVQGDNGQVWISVLSLDNLRVDKIGGEGYEYWVNGTNWDPWPNSHNDLGGNWRLEFRTEANSRDNFFLTALQLGDIGEPLKDTAKVICTPTRTSVVVGDALVSFLNDRESNPSFSYKLSNTHRVINHIIANLDPENEYSVYNQGKLIQLGSPNSSGLLTFNSDKAGYWLVVETERMDNASPGIATLLGIDGHLQEYLNQFETE